MIIFLDDLKFSLRLYGRTPLQSAIAVVMVAVSTAFAVAFFSLYENLALLSPRGFEAPAELVGIGLANDDSLDLRLPGRLRRSIADQSRTIDTAAAVMYVDAELTLDDSARSATIGVVTEEFFEGLGVAMHMGSGLAPGPAAAERVAVLDHGFWKSRFGGDGDVLGRGIEIGGARFDVVGVAHPDFKGAHRGPGAVAWLPLRSFAAAVWNASPETIADRFRMFTVGRLSSGQSASSAGLELQGLDEALRARFPDDMLGLNLTVSPDLTPDPRRHAYAVRQVELLVAAASLLAIVGAGNLSLFFLAQVPGRRREMAVRSSVGATGGRLTRQLLTESSLLVAVGVALGLLGSSWLAAILRGLPFLDGVQWEPARWFEGSTSVFVAVLALSLAATVGAAPVLVRGSLAERSRQTPGRTAMSQRWIIGAQVAVAAIVLSVAALFADSLARVSFVDGGFDYRQVTVVELARTAGEDPRDPDAVFDFRRTVGERLRAMGRIDRIGFGGVAPGVLAPATYSVAPVDGFRGEIASGVARVGADWMEVLGVRTLRGRLPAPEDQDVAVVSRRFAETAWNSIDVIGERVLAPTRFSPAGGAGEMVSLTVAAVIEDLQFSNPADLVRPLVFVNRPIGSDIDNFLLIKGGIGIRDAEAAVNEVLAQTTPRMEVARAFPLEQTIGALLAPDRSRTAVTAVAGGLTALLAALGLFGALRFIVDTERFELALRAALGADPDGLRNHVLFRGLLLVLPGLAVGFVLSLAALSHVRDAFEIHHTGLLPALVICGIVLAVIMGFAIGFPARRASRLEPAVVLKEH